MKLVMRLLPSTLDLPRSYFNPNVNYDYPVPSEDLQLPSLEPWNPNNDPKFYYELPAILTRQQQPTNIYPKKFNSDVHDKEKPFSSKPKQELVLTPITKEDYLNKQKDFDKVLLNMEKVQTHNDTNEPDTAATTGFSEGFNGHGFLGPQTNNHLITSDLSASSELHHSSPYRQHFHIQGHEGPHSYKWGYDTGKGYNRQFRYEERDKHGHVKGHYGFYDKHGKLQMFHYNADPHHGFNLDENH
ncbi:hypothetical protein RI129_004299 [Pyrocoelia pectoralis]|uniref:Uncharacterized protein n=1 Tax=Pyrocoelia pectoralis TaxID=417401 RepID=A0AAN7VC23_9COLE